MTHYTASHPPMLCANRAAFLSTCMYYLTIFKINAPHSYKCRYMYILHVAAFRYILFGGLNVYIRHYSKYIGTIKTVAVADSIDVI